MAAAKSGAVDVGTMAVVTVNRVITDSLALQAAALFVPPKMSTALVRMELRGAVGLQQG